MNKIYKLLKITKTQQIYITTIKMEMEKNMKIKPDANY